MSSRKGTWLSSMKSAELARLGEIGLGREQRHRLEPVIVVTRHRRRGDREQRAAEAIAGGVDLVARHDRRHSVECVHDAQAQVVVQLEVAVLARRIPPGDAKTVWPWSTR